MPVRCYSLRKNVCFMGFFCEQSALIDDKSANKFKNQLLLPIKLTKAAEYGLIVLGAFMLICTAALFIKQKVSSKVSCDMRDLSLDDIHTFLAQSGTFLLILLY